MSSGAYVGFVGPPFDVPIEVQLVKPKIGENDKVAIDNFGDGCISTAVSSAGGRRFDESVDCYDFRNGLTVGGATRMMNSAGAWISSLAIMPSTFLSRLK